MNFKKFILVISFLALMGMVFGTNISNVQAQQMSVTEMQALIQKLVAQIAGLQKRLTEIQKAPAVWCYDFNLTLKYGDKGDEVKTLQIVLEKEGLLSDEEMAAESGYFGESTAAGVVDFQRKYRDEISKYAGYSIRASGVFGKGTRTKLNEIYGCKVVPPPPPVEIEKGITVISPNRGEKWQRGTTHSIIWNNSGEIKIGDKADIFLSCDHPDYRSVFVERRKNEVERGYYDWLIPSSYPPLDGCKIKIQDSLNPIVFDESDATFTMNIPKEREVSKLECEKVPGTDQPKCKCIPNEAKNKFTVIIKKGGILDINAIKQELNLFLNSIENDVSIKNIGISYFTGNSVLELDKFIENLYFQSNVGYIIYVGDEVDPFEKIGTESAVDVLPLIGKDWVLESETPNPDRACKEIAMSWIIPTHNYSNSEKINFVTKAISLYTKYHKNADDVLSQFSDHYLNIQWEDGHQNLGSDLGCDDPGYEKNRIIVRNHEHNKVENELKKKPYLLYYCVHGSPTMTGIGLNPYKETNEYSAIYTTIEEFSVFVKENGTPFLLAEPHACGQISTSIEYNRPCWPETMIEAGAWSFYQIFGNGREIINLRKQLSRGSFLGDHIRNNLIEIHAVFGDITAHFPSITVISPNGGESWEMGKTYEIKWTASEIQNVMIGLQGPSLRTIASNVSASLGKYSWTVPTDVILGSNYKVLIGDTTSSLSDESNNYFSIVPVI